jgi:ADP-heptose:LPS heptosyltransferase
VVSCDNLLVQMSAAFARPQIALFGPSNPFSKRPRQAAARLISAMQPERALETFSTADHGGLMSEIPTATVTSTADELLTADAAALAAEPQIQPL